MDPDFYKALEDKFRGNRDLIKTRLQCYLPFVLPLKKIYPQANAVDLGCGRGEWLELLGEYGFSAVGVDHNEAMLAISKEFHLNVQAMDAVAFLKNLPDQSQLIISAFHLAEHLCFEDLQTLVKESLRVLKPAGFLIMETPNPENLVVASSSFYLDPTHERPLPPPLLAFLPEYYGFERIKVLRLQESLKLDNKKLELLDVLAAVSPDYAVVAQKAAGKDILCLTEEAFQAEYGLTFDRLASLYSQQQQQIEMRLMYCEKKLHHYELETLLQQKNKALGECQNKILELQAQLEKQQYIHYEQQQRIHYEQQRKMQAMEHRAQEAEKYITKLLASRSWRISAPLRLASRVVKIASARILGLPEQIKSSPNLFLAKAKHYLNQHPRLKRAILSKIKRVQTFKSPNEKLNHLNFRAKSIYYQLKNAIESESKEVK
jgi:SAM-dependent methyltransferase